MGENLTYSLDEREEKVVVYKIVNDDDNFINYTFKARDVNDLISVGRVKEFLYHEAINNLIKKTKFLQLYIQLLDSQISEEEYEQELETNPNKYFIELKDLSSSIDLSALVLIMQNLPRNLSMDEVSEIFGISTDSFLKQLNP